MALMTINNPAGDSFTTYILNAAGDQLDNIVFEAHVVDKQGNNIARLIDIDTDITYIFPRSVNVAEDGSFTIDLVGLDTANGLDDSGTVLVKDGESIDLYYSCALRRYSKTLFKFIASISALPSPRTLEDIVNTAQATVPGSSIYNTGVPEGGTTGQHLEKQSNVSYDTAWVDDNGSMPSGGTTGQQLTKSSDNDYEVQWFDPGIYAADDVDFTGVISFTGTDEVELNSGIRVFNSNLIFTDTAIQDYYYFEADSSSFYFYDDFSSPEVMLQYDHATNLFTFSGDINSQGILLDGTGDAESPYLQFISKSGVVEVTSSIYTDTSAFIFQVTATEALNMSVGLAAFNGSVAATDFNNVPLDATKDGTKYLADDGTYKLSSSFQAEVTADISDTNDAFVAVDSSLEWDSTTNGVVNFKFTVVQGSFGSNSPGAIGEAKIAIMGNSDLTCHIGYGNTLEVRSGSAETAYTFDLEVISNTCKLTIEVGADTTVFVYDITYKTFTNNSGGGGP